MCAEWWIWWCVHWVRVVRIDAQRTHQTLNRWCMKTKYHLFGYSTTHKTLRTASTHTEYGLTQTSRGGRHTQGKRERWRDVYRHKLKCNLKFCIYIKTPQLLFKPQGMVRAVHTLCDNGKTVYRNDAFIWQLQAATFVVAVAIRLRTRNCVSIDRLREIVHISDGQWSLQWTTDSDKPEEKTRLRYADALIFLAMESLVLLPIGSRDAERESIKCPFGSFQTHRTALNGAIHYSVRNSV